MNTAICLSGQPREIAKIWQYFVKNLYNQFPNPDVFIYSPELYPVDNDYFKIVKPKVYCVEPQRRFPEVEEILRKINYYDEGHINNFIQQIYGLKRVCELKQRCEQRSSKKYDLVIRSRPDMLYLRPITMDMVDIYRINTLQGQSELRMSMEFMVAPNCMDAYFNIFDWLLGAGKDKLAEFNYRLPLFNKNYDSDLILATYISSLKIPVAEPKLPHDTSSAYCYYQIMYKHKDGVTYRHADQFNKDLELYN